MLKMFLAGIVIVLLFACKYDAMDSIVATPSNMTFDLNQIDHILFTNDNGSLIAGSFNGKSTLIKTNDNFDIEWTKNDYEWGNLIFGSGWGSSFYSIQIIKAFQQNDGSYVCFGTILEGGDVVWSKLLIIVLNRRGEQVRQVEISHLSLKNVMQTSDNGYLLFGNKYIKLDAGFNQQWEKTNAYQNQITTTSDGGFATTGSYNNDQVMLKKFNSAGNELFSRTYKHNEFPFEEAGFDLTQLSDQGFLIVGRYGKSFVPNLINCQMIRTNAVGDTLWTKRFGYATNDWLEKFLSVNQNEVVVQGAIGFPNENQKSLLIKINSDGALLDSVSTKKFEMMVYSPTKSYIKVLKSDDSHIVFTKIEPNQLFTKD